MKARRDWILVILVLAAALLLYGVNRLLPKRTIEGRTAEITMAPDTVTILEETAAPVPTEAPDQTEAPVATEAPAVTAVPDVTETPASTEAPAATEEPAAIAVPAVTEAPAGTEAPATGPMMGPMLPQPKANAEVRGHVIVTLNGRQYGDPIPMDRDKIITVRQEDGKINRIHITPESVVMESSTCENQDCVGQGQITIDNYKTRILSTYIICLPNGVTVEMVPVKTE